MFDPKAKLIITTAIFGACLLFVHAENGRGGHPALLVRASWHESVEDAVAASAKSGKPIMIDFGASSCDACQDYRDEVFTTQEFQDEAAKFELVESDVSMDSKLADAYHVKELPDFRFLDKNGKEVHRLVGFEGLGLLDHMEQALAKVRS